MADKPWYKSWWGALIIAVCVFVAFSLVTGLFLTTGGAIGEAIGSILIKGLVIAAIVGTILAIKNRKK